MGSRVPFLVPFHVCIIYPPHIMILSHNSCFLKAINLSWNVNFGETRRIGIWE